jgi:hypothetical protein
VKPLISLLAPQIATKNNNKPNNPPAARHERTKKTFDVLAAEGHSPAAHTEAFSVENNLEYVALGKLLHTIIFYLVSARVHALGW